MRLRIVFLPVVGVLALSGCQTAKSSADAKAAEAQVASTQSDRLLKLAADIEARGENATAIALYQRATAMPDAKPAVFVKACRSGQRYCPGAARGAASRLLC